MIRDQQTDLISAEVEILSEVSFKDAAVWLLVPVSGLQEKAKTEAVIAEGASSPLQLPKASLHPSVNE